MKRVLMVLLFLLMAVPGYSAIVSKQMTATWEYPVSEEPYIDSFEIRDQDGNIVGSGIPATGRTFTGPVSVDSERVLAYTLVVKGKDGSYSSPSNILTIVPPRHDIKGTGKFTVKLQ